MKLQGARAAAHGRKLSQLHQVLGLRVEAQRRVLQAALDSEAARRHELAAQQAMLQRAIDRLEDCDAQIAAVRRGVFSSFDVPGHDAARARLRKAERQQAEATRAAQARLDTASRARIDASELLARLVARCDAMDRLRQRARRGAALHAALLQEVMQDDEFATRPSR